MSIRVSCSHCGKTVLAPEKAAGRNARCPACKGDVKIPADGSPVEHASSSGNIDFDVPDSFRSVISAPPKSDHVSKSIAARVPATPTPSSPQTASQTISEGPVQERLRVSCASCGKTFSAPAKLTGKSVKCPNCQKPIQVERPPSGAAADARSANKATPFEDFDAPIRREGDGEAPAANPDDPLAYLDQIGLDGLEAGTAVGMPPVVQGVKKKKRPKTNDETYREADRPDSVGDWTRVFLYAYMGIAIIPLAVSLFLPEGLGGVHLPEDSKFHWVYAGISIVGFLALLLISIRSPDAGPIMLVLVGLFTGTVGIVVLLLLQAIAFFSAGLIIRGRGIVVLFLLIVKFIGLMYYYALSSESGFWPSVYGFTFGVALCEELCKIVPVIWYLQNNRDATWKGACLVGLASGIGFGVSEGIHYAGSWYNGYAGWEIYVVRFVSCVALHAAWSATIACTMYRRADLGGGEFFDVLWGIAVWIGIPVLLHGWYDALLKHGLNGWALVTAVLTIAWMAYAVERCARSSSG